ncbi:adenosylcobinamide amidohydrolase [Dictyobacter sp. S3.2.2.5]|uniref:Adenosylcobinamide amidohydrolase n=1 Tax=Dictyobacter halimunensis TaxID=3026934 RepID=A0ABQ6FNT5_9CHLR|nr:adenosylcobinamide amidohydrolase [Dictyobacter sp. S3.2.2.5]
MLDFPGGEMHITEEAVCISCRTILSIASSALVGGGLFQAETIINYHVPPHYANAHPAKDLRAFARSKNIMGSFVGVMTAVPLHYTKTITLRHEHLTVACIITAGLRVAEAAGLSTPISSLATPGTINIILLVDAHLEASALINAIITVTEAKTAVLMEHDVRTEEGHRATGTVTDAVVIACTGRGAALPYAGPGTHIGFLLAACVRQCLTQALAWWKP